MAMLRERYLLCLFENNEKVYNENYKTDKLKEKITKNFGNRIQFWRPSSFGELVYSTDIITGQAVEATFELAASDERRELKRQLLYYSGTLRQGPRTFFRKRCLKILKTVFYYPIRTIFGGDKHNGVVNSSLLKFKDFVVLNVTEHAQIVWEF